MALAQLKEPVIIGPPFRGGESQSSRGLQVDININKALMAVQPNANQLSS